jgi:adenine-specific DNA-methyltransferase
VNEKQVVKLTEAKGRPMLHWVGKKPLNAVTVFPAQEVERYNPTNVIGEGNLLFHGDNKDVLAWLLANGYRGKVKLTYIDPPFDSGADYIRQVQLRGVKTTRIEGESYTLGEQIQYRDIWSNDTYLQFMYERLLLLKELLANDGSLYLHCDPSRNSYLRVLLDEVFGSENMVNEIVWQRLSAHNDSKRYGIIHDTIYYYAKSASRIWNPYFTPLSNEYIEQFFDQIEEETGRRYSRSDLTARGLRKGETGKPWRGIDPGEKGNHWKVPIAKLEDLDAQGRVHWPKSGGMPRLKRYLDEVQDRGRSPQDIWSDVKPIHNQSHELLDYPTQKPEVLVQRIIAASTNPGDLVMDCFVGSGTTAAVAQKLGRRWIVSDVNNGATQTTSRRLQTIIREQIAAQERPRQDNWLADDNAPPPAFLAFTTYRVNDYDLAMQHNEAVNLAVEHIGIERIKTDPFFDGTLGRELVKIIPFNHPLTLLDLQLVRDELAARPQEERNVVVVCLGKETQVDSWLEEYNKRHPVNKIRVIELRTDQKYGKFFVHQPAQAQVKISRQNKEDGCHLVIEIEDFISPTIVERLEMDTPLFKATIPEWQAMVDYIQIDTAYSGEVFNICLSDVPEKKDDLVQVWYELPAPDGLTTVAVKVVDMLGEEVLVTAEV